MTVAELKRKLQGYLDDLDDYNETDEVRVSPNTYGMGNNFLATYEGFIDFNDPVKDSEEDW